MSAAIARELGGHRRNLPAVHMADSGCPVAFFNNATLMQPLSAETAAATLDEIAAFFAFDDSSRRGEALLVSAWPTGDLRPSGWNLMGHPPLLYPPAAGAVPRSAPCGASISKKCAT